ncbi:MULTISPECIES: hypothetical protein [unclassified Haladaptatus]|uniref:hypothetical protein n=1 Tax=unclassified Haladaptatus TaxID=2622732 RepID=UPI0023E7A32A|nr:MULTISPECIES: hypothetical protein [unclassified Haladaptatus]
MADDRYVHDPAAFDSEDETASQQAEDRDFSWRGWILVGVVVVSFLVIPGLILLLPAAEDFVVSLGLSYRDTYLFLPLIPAFLLGTLAVWATTRP